LRTNNAKKIIYKGKRASIIETFTFNLNFIIFSPCSVTRITYLHISLAMHRDFVFTSRQKLPSWQSSGKLSSEAALAILDCSLLSTVLTQSISK